MTKQQKIRLIKSSFQDINDIVAKEIRMRVHNSWPETRGIRDRYDADIYLAPEGIVAYRCPPESRGGSRGGVSYRWEREKIFSASLFLYTLRGDIGINFFDAILNGIPHNNTEIDLTENSIQL